MEAPKFQKPDFGKGPVIFLKEVRSELGKISWPERATVIKLTIVVVMVSLVIGVYIGGLDLLFTKITDLLVNR